MQLSSDWKKMISATLFVVLLGAAIGVAANKYNKPKSVLHVVTLLYKDGTTDEQKKEVLDGIERMAAEIPGIRNVWLKGTSVQGNYPYKQADGSIKLRPVTDAFVIEFENEAAFQSYADHPAHRAWEKVYMNVRERSITTDVTNP
jgi:hypothetical protein